MCRIEANRHLWETVERPDSQTQWHLMVNVSCEGLGTALILEKFAPAVLWARSPMLSVALVL